MECRNFYKLLFKKRDNVDPNSEAGDFFFNNPNIPKLSDKDKAYCEGILTEEELYNNLKKFNKNKSPGLDGLTAEFFLSFWLEIKEILLAMYNESFETGILHESMRSGLIILLEKKNQDKSLVSSWRPITLLNVDYKLLTKTLGSRLKLCIGSIVHEDQNGFVPDRNIFFSAHTIRDMLFYCNKESIDMILLAIDYSKAFDSVNFECIHKTFESFGFGNNFRTWLKVIYNGGKSSVSNNGFISEPFKGKNPQIETYNSRLGERV